MADTKNGKPLFRFQPRWKEELVVTGPAGSFVLEMPMGIVSVYLPPENRWEELAPPWAIRLWSELRGELSAWCETNKIALYVDLSATVTSI